MSNDNFHKNTYINSKIKIPCSINMLIKQAEHTVIIGFDPHCPVRNKDVLLNILHDKNNTLRDVKIDNEFSDFLHMIKVSVKET